MHLSLYNTLKTMAVATALMCSLPSYSASPGITATDPHEVALQMGLGWNLGDQFDGWDRITDTYVIANETGFGNPKVTPELINAVAAAGFKTIRFPITWLGHIGPAPEYIMDPEYFNRIDEVLGYCEAAGLNVIINIHHDSAGWQNTWLWLKDCSTNDQLQQSTLAQINIVWGQIASRFKDKGPWLMFEAFNEVHDGGWGWFETDEIGKRVVGAYNQWNQTFVNAVRATGGNNATRWLAVQSIGGQVVAPDYFKMPYDPAKKTMFTPHYYGHYEYGLGVNPKYTEWGYLGVNKEPNQNEEFLIYLLDRLKTDYIDKGIPVYMGEMGSVLRYTELDRRFRRYFLEYYVKAAHDRDIPCLIWDNGRQSEDAGGECFALFDRHTYKYFADGEETVKLLNKAAYSTDPNYTLNSIYNNAEKNIFGNKNGLIDVYVTGGIVGDWWSCDYGNGNPIVKMANMFGRNVYIFETKNPNQRFKISTAANGDWGEFDSAALLPADGNYILEDGRSCPFVRYGYKDSSSDLQIKAPGHYALVVDYNTKTLGLHKIYTQWDMHGHDTDLNWNKYDSRTADIEPDGTIRTTFYVDRLYSLFTINSSQWEYEFCYHGDDPIAGYGTYTFTRGYSGCAKSKLAHPLDNVYVSMTWDPRDADQLTVRLSASDPNTKWGLSGAQPDWTTYSMDGVAESDGTYTAKIHLDKLYSSFTIHKEDWSAEYCYHDDENPLNGYGTYVFTRGYPNCPKSILTKPLENVDIEAKWNPADKNTLLVTLSNPDESGIKEIVKENVLDDNTLPVEYYRLDGIRVNSDNLAPGLYIRRQGIKRSKVLIQ